MREKTRRGRLNEYGNEYGKYAACVLSGFVLYGLSEAVGEIGDPVIKIHPQRKEIRKQDDLSVTGFLPEMSMAAGIGSMSFWWKAWKTGRNR